MDQPPHETTMKTIKLFFLWLQIRALEAFAQGQQDTLAMVADDSTRQRMKWQHMNTLAEITRLKAERRRIKRGDGIKAILSVGC